jgi:hypothetical protein
MNPTWPGAGVHTVGELRRARRRLDQKRASLSKALTAMQRGAPLHLQFDRTRGSVWTIGKMRIADDVAQLLIRRPDVIDVGDALFANATAQTYRYLNPKEDSHG